MAVTRMPNSIEHTAAADVSEGPLRVWCLLWTGATATGEIVCKNSKGTVIFRASVESPVAQGASHLVVYWPFGPSETLQGLETDALPTGKVLYILA